MFRASLSAADLAVKFGAIATPAIANVAPYREGHGIDRESSSWPQS